MSGHAFAREIRPPVAAAAPGRILQRKCAACGTPKRTEQNCAACEDEDRSVHRRSASQGEAGPHEAPPIVHEVLDSPGAPLGEGARAYFEPRFHHDFSAVRVHTDARAAASARAVSADAYTVGADIVFASGRWSGGGSDPLLAHELAHVVQQSDRGDRLTESVPISSPDDVAEREAEADARLVMAGHRVTPRTRGESGLFRQSVTTHRVTPSDAGVQGVRSPTSGTGKPLDPWHAEKEAEERNRARVTGPINMAGHPLIQDDITHGYKAAPAAPPKIWITPMIEGATFVLHDTASPVSITTMETHQKEGRRSKGAGAAAWVPTDKAAIVAHDPLFGGRRVTSTQYEKGEDIMVESDRIAGARKVWKATTKAAREDALANVLTTQGSKKGVKGAKGEFETEYADALAWLDGSGEVNSAGTWAVEDICQKVKSLSEAELSAIAATSPKDLQDACGALSALFSARKARLATMMNVEIYQIRGSDGSTAKGAKPLPAYTDNQYDNVKQLYIRAALEANLFPETTTHFLIDQKEGLEDKADGTGKKSIGDHTDPRCFDLTRLYRDIAGALHHPAGCTYGITPIYGTKKGANVWWHAPVCGGPPPA